MDFSVIEIIYLVSFFLGLGFAVLSGLLSDVFHGHSASVGDIDVSSHGPDVDLSGHHGIHEGGIHFPLVSPVTISTFIASFGGTGIILLKLKPDWGMMIQIPAAVGVAVVVTLLVFLLFYKVFGDVQISSAPRQADLIGLEAQVSVSIPREGLGQIGYLSHGSHFTAPAKSHESTEIKQGERVRILKIVNNVYVVQKIQ